MTWTRLICTAALSASLGIAASVKSWDINDYSSYLPGTLQAVSVSRDGILRLAPNITDLHQSDDAVVWTSAVGQDGTIYLGTGHGGRLYRGRPNAAAELLWTAPEIEIFALAAAPNGDIYAGTSPSGKVYRIQPNGQAAEFFDPKQEYIWQLQFGPAEASGGFGGPSALFVGTGPTGQIYRVGADGQGELWFDTEQRHITAMSLDEQGRLLAAADPNGMLYRVDGKDQAFALYDSELPEIRDIQVTPDGAIYLSAMGGAISLSDNMVQSVSSASTTITVTATGSSTDSPSLSSVPSTSTPVVSARPVVNYGIDISALIVLRPGERAEKLWTSTQENILAMALEPGDAPAVLLATDQQGRLYRVKSSSDVVLLTQTDEQQITSLLRSPRGLVMTSAYGSPTRLLTNVPAESGRYETAPLDATTIAQWGRLEFRGGGAIALQTRSGNTARPDKTWSAWTPVILEGGGGLTTSPPARYLQWAANFTAGEQWLDSVQVSYLPANAAPTISAVNVNSEISSSVSSQSGSSSASTSAYTISVTADGSADDSAAPSDSNTAGGIGATRLRISWQTEDLDGDDLLAKLEFRGEEETNWKVIKDDLTESQYSLDGEALADGRYRFRITVSDRPDNPGSSARAADRVSSLVLVDHTPPRVRVTATDALETRFEAVDGSSPIVRADYSIDAGEWHPLPSLDGLTDSLTESFSVSMADLASGEHLVTLRVRDQAGNAGLAKAVVVLP